MHMLRTERDHWVAHNADLVDEIVRGISHIPGCKTVNKTGKIIFQARMQLSSVY